MFLSFLLPFFLVFVFIAAFFHYVVAQENVFKAEFKLEFIQS
jgi:hypothetical protein